MTLAKALIRLQPLGASAPDDRPDESDLEIAANPLAGNDLYQEPVGMGEKCHFSRRVSSLAGFQ